MFGDIFSWIAYEDRAAILVDAANVHETCRKHGVFLDWKTFKHKMQLEMKLVGLHYFTGVHNKSRQDKMHKFHDFLQFSGIILHTKEFVEHRATASDMAEGSVYKANMDTEIVLAAVNLVDHVDHIILMTGDGDFTPLVKWLQGKGKWVTVISDWQDRNVEGPRQQNLCAESLRKACNFFVPIQELDKLQVLRSNRPLNGMPVEEPSDGVERL
jgi:uncharacterized LabA/DUF88 family protein